MKTSITTLLFALLSIHGFSQRSWYINNAYKADAATIHEVKLKEATQIGDLIPYYPNSQYNYLYNYASVEISATCDGKTLIAEGKDGKLTKEQKKILNAADINTNIAIKIKFDDKKTTAGTGGNKAEEVEFDINVSPEFEAEFPGGKQLMTKYVNENIINKISDPAIPALFPDVSLVFSVNEEGEINARITQPSKDPKIDALVLEAFNKMPKWKPAKTSKGVIIKQDFVLNIGKAGSGC